MNINEQVDKFRAEVMALAEKQIAEFKAKLEPEPVKSVWPQVGDLYLYIGTNGEVYSSEFSGDLVDLGRLAVGNVYRPEHRAYAERHVEAMKVQAELRRMPGVCFVVKNARYWVITKIGDKFVADWMDRSNVSHYALGGVCFVDSHSAENAIKTITPRRLAIFRDDYLQVPIEVQP